MKGPLPPPLGPSLCPLSSSQATEAQKPPGSTATHSHSTPFQPRLSPSLPCPLQPQEGPSAALTAGKWRSSAPSGKSRHLPVSCSSHLRLAVGRRGRHPAPRLAISYLLELQASRLANAHTGPAALAPLPSPSLLPLPATHTPAQVRLFCL